MSILDPVVASVEMLKIDSGCYLEKEFTKMIHMNPYMVLLLIFNYVDLCHGMWSFNSRYQRYLVNG